MRNYLSYSIPYFFAGSLIGQFIYFVLSIILVHTVSLDTLGTYTTLNNIFIFFGLFFGALTYILSIEIAHTRSIEQNESNFFFKLPASFVWHSALFSILWIISSPFLADAFSVHILIPICIITPILIPGMYAGIMRGEMIGNLHFGKLATLFIVEATMRALVVILAIHFSNEILLFASIPISFLLTFILLLTWRFPIVIKSSKREVRLEWNSSFYFSSLLFIISASSLFIVDMVIAKAFLSPSEAGHYAILSTIGKVMLALTGIANQMLIPLVNYVHSKKSLYKGLVQLIMTGSIVLLICCAMFIILARGWLLPFVFSSEKVLPIMHLVLPYTIAITLFSISIIILNLFMAQKKYITSLINSFNVAMALIAMVIFHSSLTTMVNALLGASIVAIITTIAYPPTTKYIIGRLYSYFRILRELPSFFIFPFSKHDGRKTITFLNWRDIKHPEVGGAETYVYEISKELIKRGYRIFWYTSRKDNLRYENVDGIEVVRFGNFVSTYFFAPFIYLLHLRTRTDIVIDCENGIPFFTPIYCFKKKFLLIHHVHTQIFKKYLSPQYSTVAIFMEKKVMPFLYRNTKIITVSSSTKKDVIQLGFNPENISIVHNGVNNLYIPNQKASSPIITYLGRLEKVKRIDKVLDLFQKIYDQIPDTKLYIIGAGSEENELRQYADSLTCKSSIIFTGYISEHEKISCLQKSWCNFLLSEKEGWGNSIIEANACGTCTICYDVDGVRDAIIHNYSGYLIQKDKSDENNLDNLLSTTLTLLTDQELLQTISAQALLHSKKYSWENSSLQLEKLF